MALIALTGALTKNVEMLVVAQLSPRKYEHCVFIVLRHYEVGWQRARWNKPQRRCLPANRLLFRPTAAGLSHTLGAVRQRAKAQLPRYRD